MLTQALESHQGVVANCQWMSRGATMAYGGGYQCCFVQFYYYYFFNSKVIMIMLKQYKLMSLLFVANVANFDVISLILHMPQTDNFEPCNHLSQSL